MAQQQDNQQQDNSQKATPSQPSKGMITDLHEDLIPGEFWFHARNAVMNSHLGQASQLQSEPSTLACVTVPYTYIGAIRMMDNRWAIFSTDNTDSEIGIFNEVLCTYEKLVNDPCLNFNTNYPVDGASRQLANCSEAIYWTDSGRNPRRYLDIKNVPYLFKVQDDTCKTKDFTSKLDCDNLLIERKFTLPDLTVKRTSGGELRNGMYEFGIAYAENNQRISDYYCLTNPQPIWTHENYGQAIQIDIANLDREFAQYELICIYTLNGVDNYKSLGFYSTAIDRQHVTSVDRAEYTQLDVKEVVIRRPKYPYADGVEANDHYLLWHGVRTNGELNYQKQAMNIKTKYKVYNAPVDYYAKGGNKVGYMRDEVYAFGIQWLLENGEWTPAYHIPGSKEGFQDGNATGKDVYETYLKDKGLADSADVKIWEVKNTATPISLTTVSSNEGAIGEGYMAYWESIRLYPDNKDMFGDDKCTPIRHHKFPDNCATHIYANQGNSIRILGIQFENIEHPLDADKKPIKGIKGYRIVRSDRRGNKSVVAKGVFTNVRAYKETNGQDVLYANYPYNDLRQDSFLSSSQPFYNSGEKGVRPLTDYKQDQFNFYSPDTSFSHISLGSEVRLYTEENATVKGFFEEVYKHPKAKLLTQFDLYFALIIGALDGYYAVSGKKGHTITITTNNTTKLTLGSGVLNSPSGPVTLSPTSVGVNNNVMESAVNDALNFTSAATAGGIHLNVAERILRGLATAGVLAYFILQTANKVLDIIAEVAPWQQYALQYNSHALFNSYRCVVDGNRRRYLPYYQYLFDGLNTVQGITFNNYKREDSVYLKLQAGVKDPTFQDTSRTTLEEAGACNSIGTQINTRASMYYGAIKNKLVDQYGSLDSIQYLATGYQVATLPESKDDVPKYSTDIVFGGDTYINKMSYRRSHHYFSEYLYDLPNGFQIDYKLYRNVAYPRYWIDTNPYDLSSFISIKPSLNRTPRQKHNLSCQGTNSTSGIDVVKDRHFYLFNSGVMEFFCESEINTAFRDWKASEPNFYSQFNTNLSRLFRSDKITDREEFIYDRTFSKQLIESSILQQRLDFNQKLADSCFQYYKNRVIYSLPYQREQKKDNWQVYLTNNFYEFPSTEYGNLTSIHAIDNQQLMFMFDKSAPYVSIGRDELQLDGTGKKITLGDGGLFAREPRPITYTDFQYANSQSKWAFVKTQFGSIFTSQRQGRMFSYFPTYQNPIGLDEFSRRGMHFWTKQYLPSQLLIDFPEYAYADSPIKGVGLMSAFDASNETFYIAKKDYKLKPGYKSLVSYDTVKKQFILSGASVELTDSRVFDDISVTLSYSPKDQAFISFHDWHPDAMLQGEKTFMSVKGSTIYKHNVRTDSFCNFYGIDYPFEIGIPINNGGEVDVLRSIEYSLQVGKYYNQGRDFHHILDDNFDYVTVYNSEQHSGKCKLHLQSKKDLTQLFGYPRMDPANGLVHILYNKEEQRYRINQFADIVKDRGEFSKRNLPLWTTAANGYTFELNPTALDYTKPVQHRKKFRHKSTKILFTKDICGEKKFIFNFNVAKQVRSER